MNTTDHATKTAEATQTPATRIASDIGPCPECGSPVAQFADRFECEQSHGGCTFTLAVEDIKKVTTANIADLILDAIIGDDETMGDFVRDVLSATEKHSETWHDCDGPFEYYEAQFAKDSLGRWELIITRTNTELAALRRNAH